MTTKRVAPGRTGGYTLIELTTALVVAGVLLSAAVPSFSNWVRDERRTTAVLTLLRTLQLAKSEANTRAGPVVICGLDDADRDRRLSPAEQRHCTGQDWTDGWLLGGWDDADGDATVDPAEVIALHVFQPPGELTVRAGRFVNAPNPRPAGTIVVRPFGRRSSNGTITVCDSRGPGEARGVIVSTTGRARVSTLRADGTPLACP